jgi:uncharacterized Zn-finger protein
MDSAPAQPTTKPPRHSTEELEATEALLQLSQIPTVFSTAPPAGSEPKSDGDDEEAGQKARSTMMGRPKHWCRKCDTGFSRNDHLLRHMKIHEKVQKEYPCDYCASKHSRKDNLAQHRRNLHKAGRGPEPKVCFVNADGKVVIPDDPVVASTPT